MLRLIENKVMIFAFTLLVLAVSPSSSSPVHVDLIIPEGLPMQVYAQEFCTAFVVPLNQSFFIRNITFTGPPFDLLFGCKSDVLDRIPDVKMQGWTADFKDKCLSKFYIKSGDGRDQLPDQFAYPVGAGTESDVIILCEHYHFPYVNPLPHTNVSVASFDLIPEAEAPDLMNAGILSIATDILSARTPNGMLVEISYVMNETLDINVLKIFVHAHIIGLKSDHVTIEKTSADGTEKQVITDADLFGVAESTHSYNQTVRIKDGDRLRVACSFVGPNNFIPESNHCFASFLYESGHKKPLLRNQFTTPQERIQEYTQSGHDCPEWMDSIIHCNKN